MDEKHDWHGLKARLAWIKNRIGMVKHDWHGLKARLAWIESRIGMG